MNRATRLHFWLLYGITLTVCVCVSVTLFAQGVTGSIEGIARDQTGAVVPGITVTLSSPALIRGSEVRTTAADGSYHFVALPPGTYSLTFERQGFQKVQHEGIVLRASQTVTLNEQMTVASVAQEVTVTDANVNVDVRTTEVGSTVGETVIEEVPIARRFSDLVNTLPGVQNGLYTFSPANAVNGSSTTDNVYTVNGLNFVDPQVSTAVTDIPYDDIQEAQVSTSGQTSEYGTASGGVFNYILKSGSNKFHGLAYDYTQLKALTDDNVSASQAAAGIAPTAFDHVYDYGGDIGGPVIKNRLWFFGSYSAITEPQTYSSFPSPIAQNQWSVTAKADAQITKNNKLDFFYNYRHRFFNPFNFGFTTLDPRTWISIIWQNTLYGVNYTYTPNAKTVVELRAGEALFNLFNGEPNAVPGTPVYIEQTNGVITGGPNGNFGENVRNRYQANGDVSRLISNFLGGAHQLKFGGDVELLPMNTQYIDQGFYNDTRLLTLNGAPYRIQELDYAGHKRLVTHHEDLFGEDQYVHGRFTLNLGVRYDYWSGTVGPDDLTGGFWFKPATYARREVVTMNNVAPRLGIAFDPTGHQTWVLRANYGRYYDRIDGTTYAFLSSAPQGTVTYNWKGPTTAFSFDPAALATEIGSLVSDSRPTTFGTVDPNLKMPYTDSINVGVEHQLPHGWIATLNGIVKFQRDLFSEINLADPFPTAYSQVPVVNPLTNQTMTIYNILPAYQTLKPQYELTNPSYLGRLFDDYNGMEFVLRRPLSNHYMGQISYDLGRSYGTVGTLFFDHQGSPYLNPNSMINANGDQELDRRHMVQVLGLYQMPKGFQFSGHLQIFSGFPYTTTLSGGAGVDGATYYQFTQKQYPAITSAAFIQVPIQPQGTLRTSFQNTLDLRLEKQFVIRERARLDLVLDGFNLFNGNATTSVQSLVLTQKNYLLPSSIVTPRAARFGAKFSF